jgi:DNA-binding transcriptional MocR family regulator
MLTIEGVKFLKKKIRRLKKMASLQTRGITLSQTAAFNSKKQELTATQAGIRYKRDPETRLATSEVEGYFVNVASPRNGEIQTVKLPTNVSDKISRIRTALEEDQQVLVSFKGTFRGKFWAMLGDNGRVNTGISATATELEIVKIEAFDDDLVDFDDVDV